VADSGDEADPTAAWTAAVDGAHQIVVEDQFQLGETDGFYLLEIGPARPGFTAALADAKPLVLERGKSLAVKVSVKRTNGFKEALVVRAAGLPPGVQAGEVLVPEKGGDVEVKFQAAGNAAAGGAPVWLQVWTQGETPQAATALAPLRGDDRRGSSLLDHTQALWLQVK